MLGFGDNSKLANFSEINMFYVNMCQERKIVANYVHKCPTGMNQHCNFIVWNAIRYN